MKTLQHVNFWLRILTTIRLWRKLCFRKITSQLLLLCRSDIFCNFLLFERAWSWVLKIMNCQVLNEVFSNATNFEFKKLHPDWLPTESFTTRQILSKEFLQRVRFWTEKYTPCQILKLNFYNMSGLEIKFLQRVRFRNKKKRKHFRFWVENSYKVSDFESKFSQHNQLRKQVFAASQILN